MAKNKSQENPWKFTERIRGRIPMDFLICLLNKKKRKISPDISKSAENVLGMSGKSPGNVPEVSQKCPGIVFGGTRHRQKIEK